MNFQDKTQKKIISTETNLLYMDERFKIKDDDFTRHHQNDFKTLSSKVDRYTTGKKIIAETPPPHTRIDNKTKSDRYHNDRTSGLDFKIKKSSRRTDVILVK